MRLTMRFSSVVSGVFKLTGSLEWAATIVHVLTRTSGRDGLAHISKRPVRPISHPLVA